MMYSLILYSSIISSVIFGILQYIDKNNKESEGGEWDLQKNVLTSNNAILIFMIFITCTVILYFILGEESDFLTLFGLFEEDNSNNKKINIKEPMYDVKKSNSIDPIMLRRINDPLKYGFEPYSGGSSNTSDNDINSDSNSESSTSSNDE